jgi:hypothetical protein
MTRARPFVAHSGHCALNVDTTVPAGWMIGTHCAAPMAQPGYAFHSSKPPPRRSHISTRLIGARDTPQMPISCGMLFRLGFAVRSTNLLLPARLVTCNSRLARLIRNKHDARHARLVYKNARGEIPMHQRALPIQPSHIAIGERLKSHEPSKARTLVRDFIRQVLLMLRLLGRFFAAGGPLS